MADQKSRRVFVVGVGMTKFVQAGKGPDFFVMSKEAASMALADAKLDYSRIQQAVVGYNYGDPTCGQRAVYELGLTGVPVVNVNNNCSTGSTSLFLARQAVMGGLDCVLSLGFEKMERNLSQVHFERGWTSPTQRHWDRMFNVPDAAQLGVSRSPTNPKWNEFTDNVIKLFAYAAREHMREHGTKPEHFAKIAYKNHKHSINNPFAQLQMEFPLDTIQEAPKLLEPISLLEACATADGAAAAIVCSEEFVRTHRLEGTAVEILGQAMVTDLPSSFSSSVKALSGFDMAKRAAEQAMASARVTVQDVDVVELHDCFAANELFMYEALGLAPSGGGGPLIDSAKWERNQSGGEVCRLGSRWVVNPSGGLESKGHPIGATGLAQCAELCWQLRGQAGKRQVERARVGLQHNFGIGGAAVVTVYRRLAPLAPASKL
eukprot:CAMPEP_0175923530 /NCGR_PEP_ID=MMETSP0108-20121206/14619_1 /TAXON_ID=195067 ORGANISM="Goniomonas pacifica, Strain CCMP1869" /NCGR_SAMPLE_ID=MMETSP0108 /ASSEMBLY_ACC=CAM_ASM_000204 /LENGTH=431 /DNA_ID=CAMNT_0017246535 /DNA_START=8 /DNA_END=1303 /DNA_ORIENTATION=-